MNTLAKEVKPLAHTIPSSTFARILLPTDFSDVANRALEYAKSIARYHKSELILAHVDVPLSPSSPPEAAWFDDKSTQQQSSEQLEERCAELRSEGFQARSVSLSGTLEERINDFAKKNPGTLIVMGTHGRTTLERLLLGSETEAILRNATCPVLIYGPSVRRIKDQAWPPKDIVCTSSFNLATVMIAVQAFQLADQLKASFTLFHHEEPVTEHTDEKLMQFHEAVKRLLPHLHNPAYAIHARNLNEGLSQAIAGFARERHSNLIVMGAQRTSFAATHMGGGIVPRVIADAPCPVLILHP